MNAVATNSGTYSIQNWTRYRTDDILDIFNAVETQLLKRKKKGESLERSYNRGGSDVLYVDTYARDPNPKYPGKDKPRDKVFKGGYYKCEEFRIVVPEELGLSPTERLAAIATKEGTHVPEEVLRWFIEEVSLQYGGTVLTSSTLKTVDHIETNTILSGIKIDKVPLKLRFLDSPENKKPVMESGKTRIERLARDKSRMVHGTADAFIRASEYMRRYSKELNKYAKKLGIPEYVSEQEIEEIHARLVALEKECGKVEKKLWDGH